MAQIIFGKMSGLNDSIYGKSEAPIKAFLEENVKAYTEKSFVERVFKLVDSDNYAEKFGSLTSLAQGFMPVGEGGAYPKDERREGYSKVLEHETWKDSFTITQEMIEDSKILDLNRTGARGFIDAYMLTREKYGAAFLVGAINGTTTTFRGITVDCTCNDGLSLFSTAHTSITGEGAVQSNKFANEFTLDALGLVETAMQNFTDDNGDVLTVSPDTIIIANDAAMKKKVFSAIGADKDPDTSNNAFNYEYGRWNIIVCPYLNQMPAGTWMLFDSKYNDAYNGLLLLDRIPLTVSSYVDDNTDNCVWKGRSRFVCGANDWREIAVAGVDGGTELA